LFRLGINDARAIIAAQCIDARLLGDVAPSALHNSLHNTSQARAAVYGIGTLDRKMTSFLSVRKHNCALEELGLGFRVRVRAGVSVNTISIKRVFDQV